MTKAEYILKRKQRREKLERKAYEVFKSDMQNICESDEEVWQAIKACDDNELLMYITICEE